jgi:glutamate-5-semialdehyde dehydrogenase
MRLNTPTPETAPEATLEATLAQAKQAFYAMAQLGNDQKTEALEALAEQITTATPLLLAANAKDLAENEGHLDEALYQRLKLDEGKLAQVVAGIRQVAQLPNPCGQLLSRMALDEGLVLEKKTVPLGLIAIIFESRPDVMPQILALILKSGNAVVFKGGSEAKHSNQAFMQHVLAPVQAQLGTLPTGWATLLEDRAQVQAMLAFPQYVDLVIPRGSNELVQHIMAHTRIPVLGHADGVCHLYVHPSANLAQAVAVIEDSKTQYPAACNALETLLVDAAVPAEFWPQLAAMAQRAGIGLRACPHSLSLLPQAQPATEADWTTEYGNLTLAVKVVANQAEAMAHINRYGSHHTDGILAEEAFAQELFLSAVDSASVFANASTRFADGFRFGLGAEIGISTARTHARGPVGLEGLVSTKFYLRGHGQVVSDYSGLHPAKQFTHQVL